MGTRYERGVAGAAGGGQVGGVPGAVVGGVVGLGGASGAGDDINDPKYDQKFADHQAKLAEEEQRQQKWRDAQGPGHSQSEKDAADREYYGDTEEQGGRSTNSLTPSADVGGYVGGGKDIQNFFLAGEKGNDAAQAANDAAMNNSLGNMRSNRDPIAENGALVAREAAGRKQQGQALDLQRDAAMGNAPSAAAYQTSMSMNDAMGGQAGAAGAARGLSALNGVQGAGASGMGMQASNIAMQGGMGRSQEMGQNIGMYGSSAGDMRAGDLGRVNQTNQNILAGQSNNDAWKIGNAGLAAKQGQLGNAMGQVDDSYYGASNEPAMRQLGYDQEMNALLSGASSDNAGAARARANAEGDRNRQMVGGAVNAGLTIGGSAMGGPAGGAIGGLGGGMANSYINDRKNF